MNIARLVFVKRVHEGGDIFTFYFKKPKKFQYTAGQHGVWIQPAFTRPHPFSIASSPDEKYVSFATHIRPQSRYKQRLAAMNPGDAVLFIGPLFRFTLQDAATEHVLLAQGIGITPFRSMLVRAHAEKRKEPMTLVHVDAGQHAFKDTTARYATVAQYPTDPDAFRTHALAQNKAAYYYLSGSPRFIDSTRTALVSSGVHPRHIKTDSFLGY